MRLSPQTEAEKSSEVDHLNDRSALPIPAVAIPVVRGGMHQVQMDLAPWRWSKPFKTHEVSTPMKLPCESYDRGLR